MRTIAQPPRPPHAPWLSLTTPGTDFLPRNNSVQRLAVQRLHRSPFTGCGMHVQQNLQ